MKEFYQGDIIKIADYKKQLFVIISKNAYIKAVGRFHVCPLINATFEGPTHIPITANKLTSGTVICDQIKPIDPNARTCTKVDSLKYEDIINISDCIQGLFEYD